MSFPKLKLTDSGKALIIKALAGESIEFTKIGIGNGETPDDANKITKLQNTIDSISINSIAIGDGCANIEGAFDNSNYTDGFWWKELGVFATDPNAGEVLYAYAHADDKAEYIPPYSETTLVKTTVNVTVVIGEATNVTAILGEYSGFVTNEDFKNHINNFNNPHKVTKDQVGLNLVENKVVNDLAPTYTEAETLVQMISGEKIKIAFGKIAKAISTFIKHLSEKNPHNITADKISAAKKNHSHTANEITSGILSVERGGTGANSIEDLASRINETLPNLHIGSYIGTGDSVDTISLPFTPTAVFVTNTKAQFGDIEGTFGGFATKDHDAVASATGNPVITITPNGFYVYHGTLKSQRTNDNGETYHYIAFR